MKKKITDDLELRKNIINLLRENKHVYGEPYCPCVNPTAYNEDFICPCKNFREDTPVGEECHCGLYIKISDND